MLRVALGAVALAAACVLLAPASLLDAPLATRTGGRLRLADAHGLWWRGHAILAARDAPVRVPIAWRVALAPLVAGSLVVTLDGDGTSAMPTGTMVIRDGALDASDVHLVTPASILPALVPALSPVALRGDIDLRARAFAWRRDSTSGTIDVTWQPATIVAGVLPIDLGRVAATGRPAGAAIAGTLRNAGGELAVDGSGSLRGAVADGSLKLTPTASASAALRALLALLGRPDDAGAVTLTWRSDRG